MGKHDKIAGGAGGGSGALAGLVVGPPFWRSLIIAVAVALMVVYVVKHLLEALGR